MFKSANTGLAIATLVVLLSIIPIYAQKVDYSVVSVPKESGTEMTKISSESDFVCLPPVKRTINGISWLTNRILAVSPDGENIAYLSLRNNLTNIFIKDLSRLGTSKQRTNRTAVIDFSYSPDGNQICFTESTGHFNQLFTTDATKGYVCKQITTDSQDYSPIFSQDMKNIFFTRLNDIGVSIWSFDVEDRSLLNYADGMNPFPAADNRNLYIARTGAKGNGEIWRIDLESGDEECILSDPNQSFYSPMLSPSGDMLLLVGATKISSDNSSNWYDEVYSKNFTYWNTDIYTCKIDGTNLIQRTYHAADDLSPVWSADGNYIYFISQRGNKDGVANIWRMKCLQ